VVGKARGGTIQEEADQTPRAQVGWQVDWMGIDSGSGVGQRHGRSLETTILRRREMESICLGCVRRFSCELSRDIRGIGE